MVTVQPERRESTNVDITPLIKYLEDGHPLKDFCHRYENLTRMSPQSMRIDIH